LLVDPQPGDVTELRPRGDIRGLSCEHAPDSAHAFCPAAHDVAHREDADDFGPVEHDDVAVAAGHHLLGGALKRPVGVGVCQALREVLLDEIGVEIVTGAASVQEVAL
jgi:hypothetical protein